MNMGKKMLIAIVNNQITKKTTSNEIKKDFEMINTQCFYHYRLGLVNSNTVNPKFHLNQTFYLSLIISCLRANSNEATIQRDKSDKVTIQRDKSKNFLNQSFNPKKFLIQSFNSKKFLIQSFNSKNFVIQILIQRNF